MKRPYSVIILISAHFIFSLLAMLKLISLDGVVSINGYSPEYYGFFYFGVFLFHCIIGFLLISKNPWGWRFSIVFFTFNSLFLSFHLLRYGLGEFFVNISYIDGSIAFFTVLMYLIALYILFRDITLQYFLRDNILNKKTQIINYIYNNKTKAIFLIALLHINYVVNFLRFKFSDAKYFFTAGQMGAEFSPIALYIAALIDLALVIISVSAVLGIILKKVFGWFLSMIYFVFVLVKNLYYFLYADIYMGAKIGNNIIESFGSHLYRLLFLSVIVLIINYLLKDYLLNYFSIASNSKRKKLLVIFFIGSSMFIIEQISFMLLRPF